MKQNTFIYAAIAFFVCSSCTSGKYSPVDYVDPFIGTGFHGHTYPGATVPFGAVQLSPDTRAGNWDACAGYHYDDTTLKGFSHTHLSGTGCIDLGDILFRPTTLKPDLTAESICRPANFSHKDERASAGYYSVILKDEGIKAELTATTHTGMHRYTFPSGNPLLLLSIWLIYLTMNISMKRNWNGQHLMRLWECVEPEVGQIINMFILQPSSQNLFKLLSLYRIRR